MCCLLGSEKLWGGKLKQKEDLESERGVEILSSLSSTVIRKREIKFAPAMGLPWQISG